MSNETIPLCQSFDDSKMVFPAYVSEKLDGVPIRVDVWLNPAGVVNAVALTRQGKPVGSVSKDVDIFSGAIEPYLSAGYLYTFVFEVTHREYTAFKDISGVVRRDEPQGGLLFNLFDYDAKPFGQTTGTAKWAHRMFALHNFSHCFPDNFRVIQHHKVKSPDALHLFLQNNPYKDDQEGWVIRSDSATFKPATRHWDYQKIVRDTTIDLLIVGFEEGKGKNAKAAGRLIAKYKGENIGIGAGKLTYAERAELFNQCAVKPHEGQAIFWYTPRMATIKYKPDAAYEALRQPTFQHWRHDKTDPDA